MYFWWLANFTANKGFLQFYWSKVSSLFLETSVRFVHLQHRETIDHPIEIDCCSISCRSVLKQSRNNSLRFYACRSLYSRFINNNLGASVHNYMTLRPKTLWKVTRSFRILIENSAYKFWALEYCDHLHNYDYSCLHQNFMCVPWIVQLNRGNKQWFRNNFIIAACHISREESS